MDNSAARTNTKHDFIKQFEKLYVTSKCRSRKSESSFASDSDYKFSSDKNKNKFNVNQWLKHNEQGASEVVPNVNGENVYVAQIWCMDYMDNLIAIGCSNGQIEFWEGTTGKLKVRLKFLKLPILCNIFYKLIIQNIIFCSDKLVNI